VLASLGIACRRLKHDCVDHFGIRVIDLLLQCTLFTNTMDNITYKIRSSFDMK